MTNWRIISRTTGFATISALMLSASSPLSAQTDTVLVSRVSSRQSDMERLTRELVAQRNMEGEFLRMLRSLESRWQSAGNDSVRSTFMAQSELLMTRLREASAKQIRIRRDLESMCQAMRKPEGWLGVVTTGFTAEDRRGDGPYVVRFMEQPVVESVDPGSPADRVGLRTGDVLFEIGGQQLLRRDIVFAELLKPGEKIDIKLQRDGRMIVLSPRIEPVPEIVSRTPCWIDARTAFALATPPDEPPPVAVRAGSRGGVGAVTRVQSGRDTATVVPTGSFSLVSPVPLFARGASPATIQIVAGVQFIDMNEDLGQALGVEKGVLVLQVLPGTPGGKAGFKAGDVITEADNVEVLSVATLRRLMTRARDGSLTVTVVRANKKRETLTLRW